MLYTVGEMAKRLQVAPSTLRYYDKEVRGGRCHHWPASGAH